MATDKDFSSDLKRTVSYTDLAEANVQPSAPLYRNPDRDALGDDQSILDRSTFNPPSRIGNANHEEVPIRQNSFNRDVVKNSKPQTPMIRIRKFLGDNDEDAVDEWFKKYELYAKTMNWNTENDKLKYLWTNLENGALEYYYELDEDPNVETYNEMKRRMINRFSNKFNSPLNHKEMVNRRYKKQESINTYLYDKMKLINKADATMSFSAQMNHILEGLDADLFGEVMKYIHINPVNNKEELYQAINTMYQIEEAKYNHKRNNRQVNFDDGKNRWRRNPQRTDFRGSRAAYPNNNYGNNYRNEQRMNKPFNSSTPNGSRSNSVERNSSYDRPRYSRTPDGKPICYNCDKPGHTRLSCPDLMKKEEKSEN